LKGHLIIESALDNILDLIFFHPEHLNEARLTFSQKVHLARGYALRKNANPLWTLILELNSLRNEIAHRLSRERRQQKVARIREICRTEMDPDTYRWIEGSPDELAVNMACAECLGFLGAFERDTRALKEHINALDVMLNPERERMPGFRHDVASPVRSPRQQSSTSEKAAHRSSRRVSHSRSRKPR
jgi:hypothetical protein